LLFSIILRLHFFSIAFVFPVFSNIMLMFSVLPLELVVLHCDTIVQSLLGAIWRILMRNSSAVGTSNVMASFYVDFPGYCECASLKFLRRNVED
jgi:hypothetical protein